MKVSNFDSFDAYKSSGQKFLGMLNHHTTDKVVEVRGDGKACVGRLVGDVA